MNSLPLETVISHKGCINSCDFGPRERLATASSDHDVRIWDYDSKRKCFEEVSRLSPITHHTYSVNGVRFSPQGTMLATCSSDGSTVLWDLLTGKKLASFFQPSRLGVRVVRFSPDASLLLTGGDDESACVWDIASGRQKLCYSNQSATVFAASFTPDGDHIITGDANGDLWMWSLGNTKHLMLIEEAHDLGVMTLDICEMNSNEGSWEDSGTMQNDFMMVTGGNDDSVKIWKVSTGIRYSMELEQKLCYHSSTVMCVKFSSDGKFLASSGGDKLVFLYGIPGGTVIAKIDHHNSYVGACAFSRNSKLLVTGSNDKQTAVWKLDSNDTHDLEIESNTNSTSEPFTEQGSDSTVVETASEDLERSPEIEISHASILSEKDEVSLVRVISSAHNLDINDLIFISSQRLVSVSSDKSMKLWSTDSPRSDDPPLKKIDIHKHPMYSVCSNGKLESVLITSALDGSIAFWDLPTLDSLLPPFKSKSKLGIRVCRASNDGRRLITAGDDDGAYVWNIETGTCEQELFVGGHNNTVFMACFVTETGSVAVTGCNDGYLKIWNVEEGKVIGWIEEAHDLGVVCGATRPKATDTIEQEGYSILASGGNDNLIKIWKVFYDDEKFGHCEFVQELNGHGSIIMSISFSPKTGKYLASCSGDKTVRLWNSDSFVCLRILGEHKRYISCCAFNYEENLLATGSSDKSIHIWSIKEPNIGESSRMGGQINRSDSLESNDSLNCDFICPITQDVMKYPVKCSDGYIYEKAAIKEWLTSRRKTSPMTNLPIEDLTLIPQIDLQKKIKESLHSSKTVKSKPCNT